MLQRWARSQINHLQATDYCVEIVIVLSSRDELVIQDYQYNQILIS